MKNLDDFISEKLHIGKFKKSNKDEEFYEKTSTDLLVEIQNEVDKDGEYHTYSFEDGKKKFKKGFILLNQNNEFVSITAFNTAEDFANMLGADTKYYEEYEELEIGEVSVIDDSDGSFSNVMRIW